ncbi:MAG: hypothetical protein F4Y08_00040 [Caldilineaceae bacterium SB0662_bin_9]|uniref:Uncharacterized protein n=1 Tax=Caldilineaceae bacterium SB0662_bin_9 TaxID=2605258 RepID=A0A6B1DPT5_9CHLR|nr:hypothetical protein [Caldilineaceae bacterium SB0662_bin_9]
MVTINWNETKVGDPITLADYIELTIALDLEYDSLSYGSDSFIDFIRDEPFYPEHSEFLDGDRVDEMQFAFEGAAALVDRRRSWFSNLYPFVRDGGGVQFTPGCDRKSWLPYLFFLACSHHEVICDDNLKMTEIATVFEDVCKEATRALFSESADIFLFSQFSQDRQEMGHSARDAVANLAKKLNVTVKNQDSIPSSANEFGIDIIAIDSFDDVLGIPFFAFGQCTISGDERQWYDKKDEARLERGLDRYLDIGCQHSNFFFVPHLPRVGSQEWSVAPHIISNCIFLDRYRICNAIHRLQQFGRQHSVGVVLEVIEHFLDKLGSKFDLDH